MGQAPSNIDIKEAVTVFSTSDTVTNKGKISGVVIFKQYDDHVKVTMNLAGLKRNKKHGFHIHVNGDLREGCKSCCSHYNPTGNTHGGLRDENSHAGDLGNIEGDAKGECATSFTTGKFTVSEIVGRSLIIHEDEDDLGRGDEKDSETTGHSGARIACAIIGIVNENC